MIKFITRAAWNGLHLHFANGVEVSIQVSPSHYCTRDETAEVAIIYRDNFITQRYKKGSDVLSHVSSDELALIINWATKQR